MLIRIIVYFIGEIVTDVLMFGKQRIYLPVFFLFFKSTPAGLQ